MSVEAEAQSVLVRISKRKQKKALEVLRLAVEERRYNPYLRSDYQKAEFAEALNNTIADVLKVLGYRVLHVDKNSEHDDYELALQQGLTFTSHNTINITGYSGEFWQYDDGRLWEILAPFVKSGSYLAFTIDMCAHGLFVFNQGQLTIIESD